MLFIKCHQLEAMKKICTNANRLKFCISYLYNIVFEGQVKYLKSLLSSFHNTDNKQYLEVIL